jgi:predicted ATPase
VIKTFRAKNYGCLKDVTATLTPLHAFIGPNDSGKSTLLHGLRTVVQFAGSRFERDEKGNWKPFDPLLTLSDPFDLACDAENFSYELEWRSQALSERGGPSRMTKGYTRRWEQTSALLSDETTYPAMRQFRGVRLVRFDPDALGAPSGLIPETEPVGFLDDRGLGLAGVYFAIRNQGDDAFSAVTREAREHFPTLKGIRVKAVTSSEVVLEADLTSGAKVEAKRMSEGLLYYLAFAALRHLNLVSLLLVEEPENGLHPARIVEVMRILRSIAEQGTQVILATHSPLVINEMQPDEVSVVTRTEADGTKLTLMKDTTNFAKRSSAYALGELWLSFADGIEEAPLIQGRTAP